ncbi:MAG: L-lactate dehydrogenase [Clostridia bacterium]|nr:L-lactate dehydrogenase [Clostridia bacterium]MBQ1375541.1 L-lactate dehydrogenase [Clostridia bacterium]
MALGRTKVAVIGCGSVGSTLAYNIVSNQLCGELLLIDVNKKKVWAEATDLQHSLGFSNSKVHIYDGEYADCSDADVIVITIGAPYKLGMTRLDMYEKARAVIDTIIPPVMASGFSGIFVVVSNPVDLMTQYIQKLSGLPCEKVIGTGTLLDSSRLRMYLADLLDVDPRSVNAICMGEHGDSQMIPWSQATVGGKPFLDILADDPGRFGKVNLDNIQGEISQIAYEVVAGKGATYYGIASVTAQVIRAILFDENKVLPVSCMLRGEYGASGVYAGVPAVVTSEGIKELVTYHLTEEEQRKFAASVEVLKGYTRK